MARPTTPFGAPAAYLPSVGQSVYDADDLGPITQAVRNVWGNGGGPVPSADAVAALLVAVHTLETRLIALEGA